MGILMALVDRQKKENLKKLLAKLIVRRRLSSSSSSVWSYLQNIIVTGLDVRHVIRAGKTRKYKHGPLKTKHVDFLQILFTLIDHHQIVFADPSLPDHQSIHSVNVANATIINQSTPSSNQQHHPPHKTNSFNNHHHVVRKRSSYELLHLGSVQICHVHSVSRTKVVPICRPR
jgi:hypothetical protein